MAISVLAVRLVVRVAVGAEMSTRVTSWSTAAADSPEVQAAAERTANAGPAEAADAQVGAVAAEAAVAQPWETRSLKPGTRGFHKRGPCSSNANIRRRTAAQGIATSCTRDNQTPFPFATHDHAA